MLDKRQGRGSGGGPGAAAPGADFLAAFAQPPLDATGVPSGTEAVDAPHAARGGVALDRMLLFNRRRAARQRGIQIRGRLSDTSLRPWVTKVVGMFFCVPFSVYTQIYTFEICVFSGVFHVEHRQSFHQRS